MNALLSWLRSEKIEDEQAKTIQFFLNGKELTASEWYITRGKVIIELEENNETTDNT